VISTKQFYSLALVQKSSQFDRINLAIKGLPQRLFFAYSETLYTLKKTSEKTAPSVALHNTQQALVLSTSMSKENLNHQTLGVRWLGNPDSYREAERIVFP
jgi:hypothetical protein